MCFHIFSQNNCDTFFLRKTVLVWPTKHCSFPSACDPGFFGPGCRNHCREITPDGTCAGLQFCQKIGCACMPGWTGPNCQQRECVYNFLSCFDHKPKFFQRLLKISNKLLAFFPGPPFSFPALFFEKTYVANFGSCCSRLKKQADGKTLPSFSFYALHFLNVTHWRID